MFKYIFEYPMLNFDNNLNEQIINQNNINQNNINQNNINQNNISLSNNVQNKNTQNFNQEEFKKFVGSNYAKAGYTECVFCSLYFPAEMKIGDSCGHCWAFCFGSHFNVKNLSYDGPHTLDQVKNYLKKTFNLHPKSCTNKDCIYNNITQHYKDKTLNNELALMLGFETKNEEKKVSNIVNKKRDININFKLSSISI